MLFCLSLSSLVCSWASVEVLKRIRSSVVSGLQSLCDVSVFEIMFLIFSLKCGWVYSVFLTLEYPLPVLNLLKFKFSRRALWSVLMGGVRYSISVT